jgi:3-oxoacyl-[acyl-carrier-protein] synthase II
MSRRPVAITGVGAVTPFGSGARLMHDSWVGGQSGIDDGLGRCSTFDPQLVLSRKEIHRTDRFTQMALTAAQEAIEQAGWHDGLPYEADRIGCIVGTGVGGIATIESEQDVLRTRGENAISALGLPRMMSNAPSGMIAMRHGLTGPNWGVVSACAAGAHAIGSAARLVAYGDVDAIVAGGTETGITPLGQASFARMGATSRQGLSCPFDARRDGFILGEGAGVLVLEDADAARARGVQPLGEIVGFGASSDAYHLTAPEPDGRAAARAITRCLQDAGLAADEIHYVNAHGTSTPHNDLAETSAIKLALGEHAKQVPVSSLKSAVGHLMGAAGAVEAIATLLALRARVAPPTLNYEEPDPKLDLDYAPLLPKPLSEAAVASQLIGISNSFGFGGHNAVLCIAAG